MLWQYFCLLVQALTEKYMSPLSHLETRASVLAPSLHLGGGGGCKEGPMARV